MKSSIWACILYPDSMAKDLGCILTDLHIAFALSPMHDKDINDAGEIKKPHYHLLMRYSGPISYENARKIFDRIKGVGCEQVYSLVGYYRYLTHADNPEKAQYNADDIKIYNGFERYLGNDPDLQINNVIKVCKFAANYQIYSIALLSDILNTIKPDYVKYVVHYNKYIISYMNSIRYGIDKTLNPRGIKKLGNFYVDEYGEKIAFKV